jgi:GTPase SAR1 family protein
MGSNCRGSTSTTSNNSGRQPIVAHIDLKQRAVQAKLVYYGPGLCGKTTNLEYIYKKTTPEQKGKLISLATETERTLFFDFLPSRAAFITCKKTCIFYNWSPYPLLVYTIFCFTLSFSFEKVQLS